MVKKNSLIISLLIFSLPFITIADDRQKDLKDGKIMYQQLCYSCHENGEKGAPILGYKPHWEERIKLGKDALLDNTILGKGFMLPKGGGAGESRAQFTKIVDYMLSTVSDESISNSPEMKEKVKVSLQLSNGLKLYAENCFSCHNSGENSVPQLGDEIAWEERKKQGISTLVLHVIQGHGNMIVKGGNTIESQESIKSMVLYMLSTLDQ